jgi:Flp pilus assembly protein CpaB
MSRSPDRPVRPPRPHFPLRTRFSRAAVPYWIGVALVAAITTAVVAALLGRAVEAEARYGRTQPVAVARRTLAPGDPIGGSVTVEEWPKTLVPDGAMTAAPPDDRVVVADVVEGEPLVASRVSGGGGQGAAALVPPGHRAIAVPLVVAGLPLRLGDRVDLIATPGGGDPSAVPFADGSLDVTPASADEVATGAVVVAVADESVTVAVRSDDAPDVAMAVTTGTIVVVLAGPPG